jgi:hypothetical protein
MEQGSELWEEFRDHAIGSERCLGCPCSPFEPALTEHFAKDGVERIHLVRGEENLERIAGDRIPRFLRGGF